MMRSKSVGTTGNLICFRLADMSEYTNPFKSLDITLNKLRNAPCNSSLNLLDPKSIQNLSNRTCNVLVPDASTVPEADSQPSLKSELLYRTFDTILFPFRMYLIGAKEVPRLRDISVMCGACITCMTLPSEQLSLIFI